MHDRPRLRPATAGILVAILAAVVLAVDQFTKELVLQDLPYQQAVPVWGEFLQFYLTRNPGAAFSLGEDVTWVFTIVLAVAAMTIAFLAVRRVRSRLWALVLGLLLGGILGNLTDRLIREPGFGRGHVVDFIYTPWMMPAIYNVADMFIVTMMISVALLVLSGIRLDGSRIVREARSGQDAGDDGEPGDDAPANVEPDAEPTDDVVVDAPAAEPIADDPADADSPRHADA
ncbi:MAG: signal peptidase II [Microbacterium sp.]